MQCVLQKVSQNRRYAGASEKNHSAEAVYFNKHLTESDLSFYCEVCNLKFVSDNVLKYHQKSHKTNVVFNCELCKTSFETS